jgi:predicted secreted acid phosphatase
LHPLAFQQLSMDDFKSLNLIDLSFGNKKIEKFVNREKKYIKEIKVSSLSMKEIKVSSLVMKFGSNLLDFRDENSRMCFYVNVCYREKR